MDATPPQKRFGPLEKLLLGCAMGCGALVLVGLAAGGFGAFWFFTPGKQVATDLIVGEESLGVFRTDELATDPGTQALLTKVGRAFGDLNRRHQQATLPEEMKWLSGLQRSPSARDFNRFIPREATLVLEPGRDDVPDFVLAANFRTMVRPIKAMVSLAARGENGQDSSFDYRGHVVHRVPLDGGEGAVTFVDSTLLFASARPALEKAIDRIEDRAESPGMGTLAPGLPEGDWDGVGFLHEASAAVGQLIRDYGDDPAFEPPGDGASQLDLLFGLDVVSADEVVAEVVLECPDEELAAAWLAAFGPGLEGAKRRAADFDTRLEAETEKRGSSVVARLRLTGVEGLIENTVQVDFEGEP